MNKAYKITYSDRELLQNNIISSWLLYAIIKDINKHNIIYYGIAKIGENFCIYKKLKKISDISKFFNKYYNYNYIIERYNNCVKFKMLCPSINFNIKILTRGKVK